MTQKILKIFVIKTIKNKRFDRVLSISNKFFFIYLVRSVSAPPCNSPKNFHFFFYHLYLEMSERGEKSFSSIIYLSLCLFKCLNSDRPTGDGTLIKQDWQIVKSSVCCQNVYISKMMNL